MTGRILFHPVGTLVRVKSGPDVDRIGNVIMDRGGLDDGVYIDGRPTPALVDFVNGLPRHFPYHDLEVIPDESEQEDGC